MDSNRQKVIGGRKERRMEMGEKRASDNDTRAWLGKVVLRVWILQCLAVVWTDSFSSWLVKIK